MTLSAAAAHRRYAVENPHARSAAPGLMPRRPPFSMTPAASGRVRQRETLYHVGICAETRRGAATPGERADGETDRHACDACEDELDMCRPILQRGSAYTLPVDMTRVDAVRSP